MLVLSRKKLESVVVGGTVGFERCSKSRCSSSRAVACDWASRSIRLYLSIVGRCGKRSAPAANQTDLWRTPQHRWLIERNSER